MVDRELAADGSLAFWRLCRPRGLRRGAANSIRVGRSELRRQDVRWGQVRRQLGTFGNADRLDDFSSLVRENSPRFVTFQSPGGNVLKAIELGRLIRQSALDTLQIRSLECESACAFAFMGGVKRFADPGAIGMHRASLQEFSSVNMSTLPSRLFRRSWQPRLPTLARWELIRLCFRLSRSGLRRYSLSFGQRDGAVPRCYKFRC